MGRRGGLTEITPLVLEQLAGGGSPDFSGGRYHSIDSDWHDFHDVFQAQGPPLSLAITGDSLHPECPSTFNDFCKGQSDYYFACASPGLVDQIAVALSEVTEADYLRWASSVLGRTSHDGWTRFAELKAAYSEAAAARNGLAILVG